MKLMIVDDSNIIRRRIERSQQIDRLEVVGAASNGREAVELFRRTSPDVVTMDLTMPEMDGIECVQELVALNPNVLILVVSALADKATAVEAIEKGANGFLCKPFSDRQLNEALEELLRERRNRRIEIHTPQRGQKKALLDMHPLKRLGTPEDVANAALYLASEESGWITGVVLDVAGGSVMV